MADRKPIRWAVPRGAEGYMGLAQYYLTHEENMRQSFSQPSRSARRTLPDGTIIDYVMNDVVDCIMISRPQRRVAIGVEATTNVYFALKAYMGASYYWITFDKKLNLTGVYPLAAFIEDPTTTDLVYTYYHYGIVGTIISGIKKISDWYRGPYTATWPPYVGDVLFTSTARDGGSINGHTLIEYLVYPFNGTGGDDYYSYLIKDDEDILLLHSSSDYLISEGTSNYADCCTTISIPGTTGVKCFVMRTMDAQGTYQELDWTDISSWDGNYLKVPIGGKEFIIWPYRLHRVSTNLEA